MFRFTLFVVTAVLLSLHTVHRGAAVQQVNRCNGRPQIIKALNGVFTSPNYPLVYNHNKLCVWRITVPAGLNLKLTFVNFHLESHSKCIYDYLKLQNGPSYGSPFLGKYCGNNRPPTRYAYSGSMLLTLRTDGSVSYKGFKAIFTSVPTIYSGCLGTPMEITGTRGQIKSSNHPSVYPDNQNCSWRITGPEGMRVKLSFDSFKLEYESNCNYDYVELRDGSSLLGKYCGTKVPADKIAESGTMHVTFVSDGSVHHSGFLASYSAIPLTKEACNGSSKHLIASNGVLTSPNFPNNYNSNQRCVWRLKVPDGKLVQLVFTFFSLEACYDKVEVRNGEAVTSPLLGRFCSSTPPTLYADSGSMLVTFTSDGSVNNQGFHAVFTAASPEKKCKQIVWTSRKKWLLVGHCNNNFKSTCEFKCNKGFRANGHLTTQCLLQGWSNPEPDCRRVTCPPLPSIKHGLIVPPTCGVRKIYFRRLCKYICISYGYIIQGVAAKVCTEDGTWTNFSTTVFCKDIVKPSLTRGCPIRIITNTTKQMNTANVSWEEPEANDNSGEVPKKTIRFEGQIQKTFSNNLSLPYKFPIGETTVIYTFTDAVKNAISCDFKVEVLDNEPPQVDFCPGNVKVITKDVKTNVTWEEPRFSDNSGTFYVHSNYLPHEMRWGKYYVKYTATDKWLNSAYCKFTVTVQHNGCPVLEPPVNGAQSCDTWLMGKFCTIHCDERFEFARKPESLYVCGGSGKWLPPGSTPWPDCSMVYDPKRARLGLSTEQYFKGDCSNKTVQTEIKKKFLAIFKKSLFGRFGDCLGNEDCKVENIIVKCGKMNLTILTGAGNRKKRDAGVFVTRIDFSVTANLKEQNADRVTESESQQLKNSLPGVVDIKKTLRRLAKDLNQDKNDDVIVQINQAAEFLCENGQFLKDGRKCGPCRPGSYSATGLETCVSCPESQFQNESAQTTCKQCPNGTKTPKRGAVDIQDCHGG